MKPKGLRNYSQNKAEQLQLIYKTVFINREQTE